MPPIPHPHPGQRGRARPGCSCAGAPPGPRICCLSLIPLWDRILCPLWPVPARPRGDRGDPATVTPGAGLAPPPHEADFDDMDMLPHCTGREAEAPESRVRSVGSHSPGAALGRQGPPSALAGPAPCHHGRFSGPGEAEPCRESGKEGRLSRQGHCSDTTSPAPSQVSV